ncbi:MAG: replication protein P [Pseudomonadota bacterium]
MKEAATAADAATAVNAKADPALVEAINQVFALFRINYHNQYYAAFSDAEQLRQIKKLWLDSLREYPPAQILQGARRAIDDSEYLPTLHRMRSCCEESLPALGLPATHAAYVEAANAGDPPESRQWSHPLVYWAGGDCGFQRLATLAEKDAWPLFRERYQQRCQAFLETQHCDPVPAVPARRLETQPLNREDALARVKQLRAENEL